MDPDSERKWQIKESSDWLITNGSAKERQTLALEVSFVEL